MITQRYMAAILSAVAVILTAVVAIPTGMITGAAIVQLVALGAAAINTYLSPLLNIKWRGVLKTGGAIVAAIVAILYPIIHAGGIPNSTQIALMVLAAVNVMLTQVGVDIRTDAANVIPADTTPIHASLDNDAAELLTTTATTAAVAAVTGSLLSAPSMPLAPEQISTQPTGVVEPVYAEPEQYPFNFVAEEPEEPVAANPANLQDETSAINLANLQEA